MKLTKTKKIILLGATLGILSAIAIPVVLINANKNNDQEKQNQKDVESVVKILEEKNQNKRILKFSSSLTGKIVANNQAKIIAKIKTLIGKSNLKKVKIEILMEKDRDISANYAKIKIKVSKGKYVKMVDLEKPYFVIREQNQQEIANDINSVKNALSKLTTKILELEAKVDDKSINANKDAILNTLKQVEGYSKIKFKEVKIKVKEDSNNLPSSNESPINITFILSKGDVSNIEVTGFSAKQLASEQVINITRELNQIKTSLRNLTTKEVEVYAPDQDKTITHNKARIKSAVENLDGYDAINFNGATLEVKNSGDNLPTNNQLATSIILILLKNNVKVEVQGFSAKQSLNITAQDRIDKIKEKIVDKDILIAPNVSTQNQSEIQSAIKNQLQKENIFLNNDDLSKISTNFLILEMGVKTKANLIITIDSTTSILTIDVEKANLLKNSNIINGQYGTIFQDSFKNLWAMSSSITKEVNKAEKTIHTKLQVLKVNQNEDGYVNSWTNDNSEDGELLLKGSNITNGSAGVIFQDEFKNLWAMASGTSLQVLKANQNGDGYDKSVGWNNDIDEGLTKNSSITIGNFGTIFQDKFKNLWAMSENSKLQVLKANQNGDGYDENIGWTNANSGLTKNSNIVNGWQGTIFQDQFKNLWTLTNNKKLQVLKANQNGDGYVNEGWTDANSEDGEPLLKGSNITNGTVGKIFQDEFKNLWTIGFGTNLQVLKANQNGDGYDENIGWTNANSGLTKGSNIINNYYGKIFQDQFKNLWTLTNNKNLQVLRVNQNGDGYVNEGWTDANSEDGEPLLKGSNITNGSAGIIFQDEFKNLWTVGSLTSLQVLRVNQNGDGYDENIGWTNANDSGLTNGSNINSGFYGTIFQDFFKNLWIMSGPITKTIDKVEKTIHTKLQVLKANVAEDDYLDSWQKPSD